MSDQTNATLDADQIRQKVYFTPANIDGGKTYFNSVMSSLADETNPVSVYPTFDTDAFAIPEGYGLLFQPLFTRSEKVEVDGKTKNKMFGMIVGAVPDVATVINDPRGAALVQSALLERFGRQLKGVVIDAIKDNSEELDFPQALAEFIEPKSRDSAIGEYKDLAKKYVEGFRAAGLKHVTALNLMNALMSAKFADAFYSGVKQAVWEKTLEKMKAEAMASGGSGRIFDTWLTTRDEREVVSKKEFDFSALGITLDETEDEAA